MNLRWKLRRGSDRLVVEMLGDFDETADLRDLASVLRGRIAIDLGGVRRYSSAGVREWIHFVRSLPSGVDLSLVGCSTASVTQLNLIDNFRGPARVESFWAPYSCTACGAEREVLLEARATTASSPASLAVAHAHPAAQGGASGASGSAGTAGASGSAGSAGSAGAPVHAAHAGVAAHAGIAAHAASGKPVHTAGRGHAVGNTPPPVSPVSAIVARSPVSGARTLPSPPPVACTGCGHSMVLDELPQHYLLFLSDRSVRLAERPRA